MEQFAELPMQPSLAQCPYCITETQVKVHSRKERRYRCCTCRATFSERYGTPLFRLKYPLPIVMLVLALLSHGCPLAAIVFAFGNDERTVASWQERVGYHAKRVQYQYVWHTVIGARRALCWCRRKPKSAVPIPPTSSASTPP